jgi:UDP-N-acetylglucosamine 3-dehydrogenase
VALRGTVIGLGSVGRHHARILDESSRVELVGAVEKNGNDGGLDRSRIFRSWRELRLRADLDFAVVALPTELHQEATVLLASEGVHVLVEKPLAPSRAGAHAIIDACATAKVHGAVAHVERHNPAALELRRLVLQGEIGRPLAVTTERGGPRRQPAREAGVISDLATHDLDLIPWLVDDGIEFVFAQTEATELEHVAAITGRLRGGAVFTTMVDWLSHVKTRRVRILGEQGTLLADLMEPELLLIRDDARKVSLPTAEPLARQFDAFCDLLEDRPGAPVVSLADGLAAVGAADAAMRSAREDRPISL